MKHVLSILLSLGSTLAISAQEPVFNFPIDKPIVEDTLVYYEPTTFRSPSIGEEIYVDKFGGWLKIVERGTEENETIKAKSNDENVFTLDKNSGRVLYVSRSYGSGRMACPTTQSQPTYKTVTTEHYAKTSDGKVIIKEQPGGRLERVVLHTSKSKVATGYSDKVCPICKGTGYRYSNVRVVESGRIKRILFKERDVFFRKQGELEQNNLRHLKWGYEDFCEKEAERFLQFYNNLKTEDKNIDVKEYMIQLQYQWIQKANTEAGLSLAYRDVLFNTYRQNPQAALAFIKNVHPSILEGLLGHVDFKDKEQMKFYASNGVYSWDFLLKENHFELLADELQRTQYSVDNLEFGTPEFIAHYYTIYLKADNSKSDLYAVVNDLMKTWKSRAESEQELFEAYLYLVNALHIKNKIAAFELMIKLDSSACNYIMERIKVDNYRQWSFYVTLAKEYQKKRQKH